MVRNITRVRRRMGDGEGVILRPFRGTPSESAWPRPDGWIRVAFPAGHGRRQKYARINRDRRDVVTGLRMMAATRMIGYGYKEEELRRGVDQGRDFIEHEEGSRYHGDRKRVVSEKRETVREDVDGRRHINKKEPNKKQ